jgi:hypothetical protein
MILFGSDIGFDPRIMLTLSSSFSLDIRSGKIASGKVEQRVFGGRIIQKKFASEFGIASIVFGRSRWRRGCRRFFRIA